MKERNIYLKDYVKMGKGKKNISERRLHEIIREEIEKTKHFIKDRENRVRAIEELGGYGKSICMNIQDRGHSDGPEIFVLTDNAIIKVYNAETRRHITDLIPRPEQIIDRMGTSLSSLDKETLLQLFRLARKHEEDGYNNR